MGMFVRFWRIGQGERTPPQLPVAGRNPVAPWPCNRKMVARNRSHMAICNHQSQTRSTLSRARSPIERYETMEPIAVKEQR